MAEYINREAALHEIERREALMVGDKCVSVAAMKSFIKNRPTADVAPVVRCKGCTSGMVSDNNEYIICCRLGVGMDFDDFCSHGERKDEVNESQLE